MTRSPRHGRALAPDPGARLKKAPERGHPRPQLPDRRGPGRGRFRRRLARAQPEGGGRRKPTSSSSAASISWPRPRPSSSPDKTVLLPDPQAGCPMADMITAEELVALEGPIPRPAGRLLRQHVGRGQGRMRHLLHLGQRGPGRRLAPRAARCCSPPTGTWPPGSAGQTSKTIIPWDGYCYRPQQHPGPGHPRSKEASSGGRGLGPSRMPARGHRPGRQDPVHRRDGPGGADAPTPARSSWPPRPTMIYRLEKENPGKAFFPAHELAYLRQHEEDHAGQSGRGARRRWSTASSSRRRSPTGPGEPSSDDRA